MIEDFSELMGAHLDTVWNPTVIDYVRYVNAAKQLKLYQGAEDTILFDNSANDMPVWVTIKGTPVELAAGAQTTIDPDEIAPTVHTDPVNHPVSVGVAVRVTIGQPVRNADCNTDTNGKADGSPAANPAAGGGWTVYDHDVFLPDG